MSAKKFSFGAKKTVTRGVNTFCTGKTPEVTTVTETVYTSAYTAYTSSSHDVPQILPMPIVTSEDYDLVVLDSQIREHIISKKNSIRTMYAELETCLRIVKRGDITQRILASQTIPRLRNKIKDLETTMELGLYILRVSEVLEEYRQLSRTSFVRDVTSPTSKRKMDLRRIFLGCVRDYIVLNIPKRRVNRVLSCGVCGSRDTRVSEDDDAIHVCMKCFHEFEIPVETPSYKDTDRVNLSNKYVYSRRGHFTDAVKHLQGQQHYDKNKVEHVLEIIRAEMEYHVLVTEREQTNSVTKNNVHTILVNMGLSKHYIDLNLLYMLLTGEECPNLSPFMDKLFADFDQLEDALEKIKDGGRVNSLNVFYKLYKLLQRISPGWRKSDFYILKTKAKEDEHDEKMKKAFDLLGWEWKPTY